MGDVAWELDVYGGVTRRGESHPSGTVRESHRLEMVECPVSSPARDAARPLPRLVPFPMTVPEDRQRALLGQAGNGSWRNGQQSMPGGFAAADLQCETFKIVVGDRGNNGESSSDFSRDSVHLSGVRPATGRSGSEPAFPSRAALTGTCVWRLAELDQANCHFSADPDSGVPGSVPGIFATSHTGRTRGISGLSDCHAALDRPAIPVADLTARVSAHGDAGAIDSNHWDRRSDLGQSGIDVISSATPAAHSTPGFFGGGAAGEFRP